MASHWKSRREVPGFLEIPKEDVGRRGILQGGLGSSPGVLEWVQEDSGTIPGNSQRGLLVLPIPQKVARGS